MKHLSRHLFVIISFLLLGCGCGSQFDDIVSGNTNSQQDEASGGGTGGGETGSLLGQTNIRQVDVSVLLPQGASTTLEQTRVMAQLASFPVGADGTAKALQDPEGRVLAILLDQEDNTLLAGYITDDKTEVSVASTIEVLLFFGLNTNTLPEEIRNQFWNEVRTFDGFDNIVAQAEALFVANPNFLDSQELRDIIRPYLKELALETDTLDIRGRLDFDSSIKSGLRLEKKEGDVITVINDSRRRCHAFVYKTTQTDNTGQTTVLISDFESQNPASMADVQAGPTAGVVGIIGIFQTAASGKGADFAVTESDPVSVGLSASEREATFKVRVVGPSLRPTQLTNQEEERLHRLEYETLALDYILPLLMGAASQDNFLKEIKESGGEEFVNAATLAVSSIPSADDAVKKGDYGGALLAVVGAFADGTLGSLGERLIEAAYNLGVNQAKKISPEDGDRLAKSGARLNVLVRGVEKLQAVVDWGRILTSPFRTQMVEEFELTNTRNRVQIIPPESVAIQGESKELRAVVNNGSLAQGQVYEYQWSTSGNYGEIRDSLGKSGTSFATSQSTITYFSNNSVSLPGVATETVNVKVIVREGMSETDVDEAEATLQVRESGFEIEPNGVTISGCQSITLRVNRTDGTDPVSDSTFDYRFEWGSSGSYGWFTNGKYETKLNDNSVRYTALEKENDVTESISCAIYARPKGSSESYQFLDTVNSTLEIDNDPNCMYMYSDIAVFSTIISEDFGYSAYNHFDFAPVPNALRYQLTVIEHDPPGIPTFVGSGRTWDAGNPGDLNEAGNYRFITFNGTGPVTALSDALSFLGAVSGTAQIKVTLDPNRPQ